jgi:CBS domain-containing protein
MTSTVGDVLRSKGRAIYSIDARRTVHDAIEQMVRYDVAALVVTDEKSELAGIVTERDVAKKVVLRDRSPKLVSVKEVMTREVVSVRDETPTSTCMEIMSQKDFHHLPVIENNRPVAIVTAGDLFKFVVSEQSMEIGKLEGHIFEEQKEGARLSG